MTPWPPSSSERTLPPGRRLRSDRGARRRSGDRDGAGGNSRQSFDLLATQPGAAQSCAGIAFRNCTAAQSRRTPHTRRVEPNFISAHFAAQTKFDEDDLKLLWDALTTMFITTTRQHAARWRRAASTCSNTIADLGNAPADKLFDLIRVAARSEHPARGPSRINLTNTLPAGSALRAFPGVELQILCN